MPDWWGELDWGSVPDWFAGVGTVGTLVIAVAVLKREADDRRARDEYERSSQARLVHLGPVLVDGASGDRGKFADRVWTVTVTNGSDDAIHDVELGLQVEGSEALEGSSPSSQSEREVLAQQDSMKHTHTVRIKWEDPEQHIIPEPPCYPYLRFRDMTGQEWVRGWDYRLHPVSTAGSRSRRRLRLENRLPPKPRP